MSWDALIVANLRERTRQAHNESARFDIEGVDDAVATFYRQATPGTTYWRCFIPARRLPAQVVPVSEDSLSENGDGTFALKEARGTLVWQFLGDEGRSRVALQMRRQGVFTVMEVDDNYLRFAPPLYGKFGAWQRTHAEAVANGTGYSTEMHRKVVPLMDGLIVSTENLADEYDAFLAKQGVDIPITVCPNSVDPTDWDVERTESDVLRIGYYGSSSHVKDYPLVKKALKWAARQPDVEVSMLGFRPPGWTGRVAPWADNLFDARANLSHIDVGIAPLKSNPWADGKSDVKLLEYAMAGVMPIAQDAPPYRPWRDEWSWKWLAKTEDDWMDMIQTVVRNPEIVKDEAASAEGYVRRLRTIQANIERWREAVRAP